MHFCANLVCRARRHRLGRAAPGRGGRRRRASWRARRPCRAGSPRDLARGPGPADRGAGHRTGAIRADRPVRTRASPCAARTVGTVRAAAISAGPRVGLSHGDRRARGGSGSPATPSCQRRTGRAASRARRTRRWQDGRPVTGEASERDRRPAPAARSHRPDHRPGRTARGPRRRPGHALLRLRPDRAEPARRQPGPVAHRCAALQHAGHRRSRWSAAPPA